MGAVKSTLAGFIDQQDFAGIDDRVRDASDNPLQRCYIEFVLWIIKFDVIFLLSEAPREEEKLKITSVPVMMKLRDY